MKKLFISILPLVILFTNPLFADTSRLKVGVILPLSGALADFGYSIQNGIRLYQEEVGEEGKVVYIFEDDQYDPKSSISAYRKLRDVSKVDLFFSFGSPACSVLSPIVDRENEFMLCFTSDEESARGAKNVIRAHDHSGVYMDALLEELRRREIKDFKIISTEMGYVNSMIKALKRGLREGESFQGIGSVTPGELDFRSIILKAKSLKAQSLGVFLLPSQIISFLRQSRELGFSFEFYSTNLIESALYLPQGGSLEGGLYAYYQLGPNFVKKYEKRFRINAQLPMASNAYDMAEILEEGFKGQQSVEEFMEIFKSVKDKEGGAGKFSYREDEVGGKYFLHKIYPKVIKGEEGVVIDSH